jgi:DnaJ-class molecular chaperone
MNLNKNYYSILESSNKDDINLIKKSYYKLSKKYHPDLNNDPNINIIFTELSEAWEVISDIKSKEEYDKKSKWGKDYNELEEFFKIDMDYNHKEAERTYDDVKKREVLDIIVQVDKDTFDGTLEFARWVQCPTCKGNGKDMSSRIVIKGLDGKEKIFDADDGCDFCDGIGKGWDGNECGFCNGKGKVGINPCKKCFGDGRIQGKQKLKDVKLEGDETKIESMGNWKFGRVGSLIIKITL